MDGIEDNSGTPQQQNPFSSPVGNNNNNGNISIFKPNNNNANTTNLQSPSFTGNLNSIGSAGHLLQATNNLAAQGSPPDNISNHNPSEPVSVDELETILRDWHFDEEPQERQDRLVSGIISPLRNNYTNNNTFGNNIVQNNLFGNQNLNVPGSSSSSSSNNRPTVDVNSWSNELLNALKMCNNDENAALGVVRNYLQAFEMNISTDERMRNAKLNTANKVLAKTLKTIHRQHKKIISTDIPAGNAEIARLKQELQMSGKPEPGAAAAPEQGLER